MPREEHQCEGMLMMGLSAGTGGLKEMRWNRIKRTSSSMTGKDGFRDFCLRE